MTFSEKFEKNVAAIREAESGRLTAKQRKFALNVHRGMSDYEAAVEAGYGEGAKQRANELRNDSRVQLLLDRLSVGEVTEPDKLTEDYVIRRLLRITELCAKRGKFVPALKALELLGRHLKMFSDKPEVSPVDGLAERLAEARARLDEEQKQLPEAASVEPGKLN